MRILITGSNGLLGQKIVRQLKKHNKDFLATSIGSNRNQDCPSNHFMSMDITDIQDVRQVVSEYKPTAIINTAAMTLVDDCEDEIEKCRKINVDGVANLLEVCKEEGIYFVQVSTDFVFDGESGPYKEEDERNPLSVYSTSKRDAEDVLMDQEYDNWSILRTIIVYGTGNNLSRSNIVLWAREALKKGTELTIVNDQFRAPTWADDLAWACIRSCELNAKGVFHISGPETFSIYELVCRIADYYGYDKSIIRPISSSTLNQKAKRPPKTGFDISKARKILGYKPKTIEESLAVLDTQTV